MKKALLVATALLIATPAITVAQDDHHHEGGGHGPAATQSRPASPSAPAAAPASAYHGQGSPSPMGGGYRGPTNGAVEAQGRGPPAGARGQGPGGYPQANAYRGPSNGGQPERAPAFQGQGPGGPHPPGGYPAFGGERFNRPTGQAYAGGPGARGGGQPFGYGGRQYFRYRAAPYRYPVGYYSWNNHIWRRGEWLPPVFTSAAYYIDDWYDFGLWEPSYGYEWIRVGADAVLINLADGQVADVVPGIYY